MSTTVGMDIDHIPKDEMQAVRERILAKKDELGLRMLEESARGEGYHLVFSRRPEMSQEGNLKWASDLLGVEFDKDAKDITRVFFTTTEAELIYLDDGVFEISEAPPVSSRLSAAHGEISGDSCVPSVASGKAEYSTTLGMTSGALGMTEGKTFPTHYHGIPFTDIIKKYWEVNNRGFEPTEGDRDTLTYQLACDLRHICGRVARSGDSLLRRIPAGREACEDQECACLRVQRLPAASPQHAECAGKRSLDCDTPLVRKRFLDCARNDK